MSRSIDERVVDMQFNNRQFESGVRDSIDSLEKLKKGLNLDESAKSLLGLNEAANKFSLDGIANGVEAIAAKFTTLGIIGITALQNVANKAIDAGAQMLKALTMDPIIVGFNKYEELLTHTNTIVNATGKELSEVEEVMDRLMWYTDETSYNMTDMADNIGKFTAQGIDLAVSENAMEGIANWAAVSGQNASTASIAMRNMADAMGKGHMSAQDWKSIEIANMATAEFRETAIDAAIAIGQLGKNGEILQGSMKGTVVTINNFKDTLSNQASQGWFNQEAMLKTLGQYGEFTEAVFQLTQETGMSSADAMNQLADSFEGVGIKSFKAAQESKTFTDALNYTKDSISSSWGLSFKYIIGDVEEAKKLWSEFTDFMYDAVVSSGEVRNEILKGWKKLGGRDELIQSFRNITEAIGAIIDPIREAFRDFFPATTSGQLTLLTKKFKDFTEKIKIGEETADKLRRSFAGVFAVLDLFRQALGFAYKVVKSFFGLFAGDAANGILDITANIGDFLVGLNAAAKEANIFNVTFLRIKEVFNLVAEKIKEAFNKIIASVNEVKGVDLWPFKKASEDAENGAKPFDRLGKIFSGAYEIIVKVLEWASPIIYKLATLVATALGGLADRISNAVENLEFNTILDLINTGLLAGVLIGIKNFMSSMASFGGITSILDGVCGSLEAFTNTLKAKSLLTISIAIGILAAALIGLSLIDSNKLAGALAAISVLFIELSTSMTLLQNNMAGKKGLGLVTTHMILMATALLILSFAMRNLASLDWESVAKGIIGIGALATTLIIASNQMSKNTGKLISSGIGLIVFAAAILILTQAVEELGALDPAKLTQGLIGVGILLTELAIFMKVTDVLKGSVGKGVGLIAMAIAINILASAVEAFGSLDVDQLIKGLSTMGIVLAELAIFMNLTGNAKHVISTGIAMVILGGAMLIFAEAIGRMGNMQWDEIARGLTAMAGALAAVTISMNLMPQGMIVKATGMIIVAAALVILAEALKNMGGMSWEEVGRSLVTLAGSMTILIIALTLMSGALPGAAALLVVAGALAILAPVLKTFGGMSLAEIGKALLTLVGVFAIFGLAASVLTPVIPSMFALAAAIALLGIGALAAGAGVLMFATGLTALAVGGTAYTAALIAVITGVVSLIPMLIEQLGVALILLAGVLADAAPSFLVAAVIFISTLLTAINIIGPKIADAILNLILDLLRIIDSKLPDVLDAGFDILISFLKGIENNIDRLAEAAVDLILEFINSILKQRLRMINAGFDTIVSFIDGTTEAIKKNEQRLIDSALGLAEAIINGMVKGLLGGFVTVGDCAKGLGKSALNGIKDFLDIRSPSKEFMKVGSFIVSGLINGLKESFGDVTNASVKLGSTMLTGIQDFLGINSPSTVARDEVGRYFVQGIAEGITEDMSAEEAATKKAQNIVNAFKTELDKFSLDATTVDLELKLWESLNTDVPDGDKMVAKMDALNEKFTIQSEKVVLAQDEYRETLSVFGDASEEAQRAYNKFLNEQIALADIINTIKSNQDEYAEYQDQASQRYYEYLRQNQEMLSYYGYSMEEIQAEARNQSGYNPTAFQPDLANDLTKTVTDTMTVVEEAYETSTETVFGKLKTKFIDWGKSYATALSEGLAEESPQAIDTTNSLANNLVQTIKGRATDWVDLGKNLVDGFGIGIQENIPKAVQAAIDMAVAALEAAMEAIGAASPAKKFIALGKFADWGFAIGLKKYSHLAEDEASDMGKTAIDSLSSAMNDVSKMIDDDFDMSPTIRPVVDFTDIKTGAKTIGQFLNNQTISLDGATKKAMAAQVVTSDKISNQGNIGQNNGATVSYTQNNYSPKALSRLDIYRQTRNQISTLKGLVGAT